MQGAFGSNGTCQKKKTCQKKNCLSNVTRNIGNFRKPPPRELFREILKKSWVMLFDVAVQVPAATLSVPYWRTCTFSMVTRPLLIIWSSTGRNASIFSVEIDNLHDDRQILRQPQNLGGVDAAGMPEAGLAAQHGRAAKMQFARLQYDGFVQGQTAGLVVFAEVDAEQYGVVGNLHGVRSTSWC